MFCLYRFRLGCVNSALPVLPGCIGRGGGVAGTHEQPAREPERGDFQLPPLPPDAHLPSGAAGAPALLPHGDPGGAGGQGGTGLHLAQGKKLRC